MKIRNGDYTIFRGHHLMIREIRDDDETYLLSYVGPECPFDDFNKSRHEKDTYNFIVNRDEIKFAYHVKTMGEYRNFKFEIFSINISSRENVRIASRDKQARDTLNLTEVQVAWYIKDINDSELSSIWEERLPTKNLPMTPGIEAMKIIK